MSHRVRSVSISLRTGRNMARRPAPSQVGASPVPNFRPGFVGIRLKIFTFFFILATAVAGCGTLPRNAVPVEAMPRAEVAGFEHVRATPIDPDQDVIRDVEMSFEQERAIGLFKTAPGRRAYASLLISGGADYGAFGAGLLKGWSESGQRPVFKFVTGVSAGALIAPLAFLGSAYDAELERAFTTVTAENIFILRSIFSMLPGTESLADTRPLRDNIASYIDEDVMREIARAHRNGRRLFILTTNLDSQTPYFWNMGAIAERGTPEALELFRAIMLASASIPGIFPPVHLPVEVDGQTYDEIHVDGGLTAQVFSVHPLVDLKALGLAEASRDGAADAASVPQEFFVIRNGIIEPEPRPVPGRLTDILKATVNTMMKYVGAWDLYRLYHIASVTGGEFRFVSVPPAFEAVSEEMFDQRVMQALFDLGYEMGSTGDPWLRQPPYYPRYLRH